MACWCKALHHLLSMQRRILGFGQGWHTNSMFPYTQSATALLAAGNHMFNLATPQHKFRKSRQHLNIPYASDWSNSTHMTWNAP